MSTTISRRVLVIAASLIGVAWTGLARADSFKFPLTGEQCVPPVATNGTGEVELTYDPATRVVAWNIPYSGLSSAVTLAHFHGPAIPGKSGPVVVWLAERGTPPGNPISGQATLTPEQAQQFAAGEWYVNVHTQSYPACELRGQVVPPKS
ncbi:MAG: CHRD domain-containing protein [Alphaproteobacteria bacterium]|nr:MAG: CHRD domain-containing protein [Alphaproteobacteria bacterium]